MIKKNTHTKTHIFESAQCKTSIFLFLGLQTRTQIIEFSGKKNKIEKMDIF
jgi:hypothetical protein